MHGFKAYPAIQAILAAILFGASAPLSKVLLGDIEPVPLASFLYLGSGIGLLLSKSIQGIISKQNGKEAPLTRKDFPWLLGAIVFGGVIAPIILMVSLQTTPASTASLLLNFEGVATTLIALLVFKENIGRRVGIAVSLITLSSILLSWDVSNQWGFSLGALGVISACICWGIDNNFTRNISAKNPFTIVIAKGIGAGLFSLLLTFIFKIHLPSFKLVLGAMFLGFFSYGLSIVLFVLAMRSMGSARTSAFFGTAPFIGAFLSFLLFKSSVNELFITALPLMVFGAILLLKDEHGHLHIHYEIKHEHKHTHNDGHHNHVHEIATNPSDDSHSHIHDHEVLEHSHQHFPDIHHRHDHRDL
jgi:Permeases of the drug/metabolite transporter (DMT) superfamily